MTLEHGTTFVASHTQMLLTKFGEFELSMWEKKQIVRKTKKGEKKQHGILGTNISCLGKVVIIKIKVFILHESPRDRILLKSEDR